MKMLQEPEEARCDRKFIKSQVEKRRRERINRSLEHLRTMLLPEPQHTGGTHHRVEKAEILERTVLFLQNTAGPSKTRAEGGGGGQKHSFQDGFSTCLQKAAQFLGPEGKGLWLGSALDASYAARFPGSDSECAAAQKRTEELFTSRSLSNTKSILEKLRQKSRKNLRPSGLNTSAHPYQDPEQQRFPLGQQEHQSPNTLDLSVEGQASKQSPSPGHPASQTLWRPWP